MPRESADPYVWPGTLVLRNRHGIRDAAALSRFEYEYVKWRTDELRSRPVVGTFDLEQVQAIHARLFGGLYDWAGKFRTVSISIDGDTFAVPAFLDAYARRMSTALAEEQHLRGLDRPQFVDRMTHYYAEWNALHPFREGNGRTLREFFGQLAREAGYALDQTRIEPHKEQWHLASKKSFQGDLAALKRIFDGAITQKA